MFIKLLFSLLYSLSIRDCIFFTSYHSGLFLKRLVLRFLLLLWFWISFYVWRRSFRFWRFLLFLAILLFCVIFVKNWFVWASVSCALELLHGTKLFGLHFLDFLLSSGFEFLEFLISLLSIRFFQLIIVIGHDILLKAVRLTKVLLLLIQLIANVLQVCLSQIKVILIVFFQIFLAHLHGSCSKLHSDHSFVFFRIWDALVVLCLFKVKGTKVVIIKVSLQLCDEFISSLQVVNFHLCRVFVLV